MSPYQLSLAERAERGALFLDAKQPGWAAHIITDELDMGQCDMCVLGQLSDDGAGYDDCALQLGIDPWGDEARELGFLQYQGESGWDLDIAEHWTAEIDKRLGHAA